MTGDPYEMAEREARHPHLQAFLDEYAGEHEIPDDFVAATAHPFTCRCDRCKDWWSEVGPDEDGSFGPFREAEIMKYCLDARKPVWWEGT